MGGRCVRASVQVRLLRAAPRPNLKIDRDALALGAPWVHTVLMETMTQNSTAKLPEHRRMSHPVPFASRQDAATQSLLEMLWAAELQALRAAARAKRLVKS